MNADNVKIKLKALDYVMTPMAALSPVQWLMNEMDDLIYEISIEEMHKGFSTERVQEAFDTLDDLRKLLKKHENEESNGLALKQRVPFALKISRAIDAVNKALQPNAA